MADPAAALILVVDDDEAKRYSITKILQKAGYRIRQAVTGGEALRMVAELPDLVVLDVKLPDVSGFEVCRRIKADPVTSEIPVLHMSTTFVDLEDKLQGLEGGADGYLTDVLEPLELIATVKALLRARRAEEAAQISNSQWQATFDAINDGVVLLDREGLVIQVNQAMERIFEAPWDELHGRDFHDLFGLPAGADASPFTRMASSQAREEAEVTRGGRWLHVTVDPLRSARGTPRGALGIVSDVTARRLMEEELRRRAEELATADRRKDEFLAMLAHELRNPLAPIMNCLGLIRREAPPGQVLGLSLEIVERQVKHMSRLLDDLLDVSRFSQGKIQLRKADVDFSAVVAHAVETATPLIQGKQHRLTVRLPEGPLPLHGDPTRLEQVVANLLNNAAKYTNPGGDIRLSVDREGGELALRVADTGIGMSGEMMARVFDLFAQADLSLDRSQGGLGIGLTLARNLVELHGGRIEVRSEGPGRGSEFTVHFPLAEPAPAAVAPPAPAATAATRLRILVVDDHSDSATSLAQLLVSWGHDAGVAPDGPAALRRFSERPCDAVVLDIGLPGMDGFEVAARLRACPDGDRARLIALTGYGQQQDIRRSAESGIDHHLVKPVEQDVLRGLLDDVAASRGLPPDPPPPPG
ncbi:Sensor protein EvgS precursor [Aquisphaera giovannonii]|uniref:histidine kinase n=1 Tax=Aquisphaera giovannonii TaxID=406548 RepID=A0A5B9W2L6_9BACT|nr:response regulator [Aquisphaera giovannonii]QEH34524.1 Sensor protein EvgS precursor [Aquisphaera giovannonii]